MELPITICVFDGGVFSSLQPHPFSFLEISTMYVDFSCKVLPQVLFCDSAACIDWRKPVVVKKIGGRKKIFFRSSIVLESIPFLKCVTYMSKIFFLYSLFSSVIEIRGEVPASLIFSTLIQSNLIWSITQVIELYVKPARTRSFLK